MPKRTPLASVCADFLDDCRLRNKSPRTVRWYEDKLIRFTEFARQEGAKYLEDCDKRLANRFLAERSRNAGPFTVNGYVETLKRLANWSVREGYLAAHPFQRLEKLKTPRDLPRTLSKAEVQRFLAACTGRTKLRDRAMALFLYDTGCRLGEALGLTVSAIHAKQGYAVVRGKGNKERLVPLSEPTIKALRDYQRFERRPKAEAEDIVFLTYDGTPIVSLRINFANHFREIAHRAGLKRANPHMWRHTAATEMLRNGANTAQVQKILGHEHISTTEIYTHLVSADVLSIHRTASPALRLMGRTA